MNILIRWWRFNLVGAMGVAVQLGSLAWLSRWAGVHYLFASAAALELTLLHNFLWHVRYTWRDRSEAGGRVRQFGRFQLSSGVVSLAGNLVLMRLLVQGAHLPVVLSNLVSILCCSLLNFWVGNGWAFARAGSDRRGRRVDRQRLS